METLKEPLETPPPPQLPEEANQEQPHQNSDNDVPKFPISEKNGVQSDEPRSPCALDNFKKMIMNVACACARAKADPLSSTQTSLLERHLDHLLPRLHTPDHPPYAAMIQEAIEQLNEQEGSGKELISTLIKKSYNDLPWDHDGMLEHHLNLLCKNGVLVRTKDGHYLVSKGDERSDGPSCILASTADTSLSLGPSYNSFSSYSSSSESDYKSEVLWKESLQQKNGKLDKRVKGNEKSGKSEARMRKRNGRLRKSVNGTENFLKRTKSSIRRLGSSSKKVDFLTSSEVAAATNHGLMLQQEEKEELNGVASEEYGNTEQPGDHTLDSDNGFEEPKNKKKRGRERCGKRKLNGERKKTTKMRSSRPPRKVVLSEVENCLMTEEKVVVAKDETQSLNNHNVDITKLNEATGGESLDTNYRPYEEHNFEEVVKQQIIVCDGSPDELSEKQNNHVDNVNEVIGKQNVLLNLLQESASGEFLLDQEDKEGEDNTRIEVIDSHTEAATKNPGRKNTRKCKQGANAKGITPIQTPVAGKGSGKQRDMMKKNLEFEVTNPISEEMTADNETTGKVHQVQEAVESNLQDRPLGLQIATCEQYLPVEVPKRGRGRPPKTEKRVQLKPPVKNDASKKKSKLQDPNEEGKEVNKRRVRKPPVPGRKRGRPPKSETARQLQIIQEQLKTMGLQKEEKDSRNIDVGGNRVTEQTGISSY